MTGAVTIRSPRVLLVNDEKRLRDSWSRLLTRRGYTPMTAESGQSAIDILATEPPDVVLLDLKMPVIEGRALLDIIAKEYRDIPVVIVTGHGTVETAMECIRRGAYGATPWMGKRRSRMT